tara:strand:- start:43 stop:354 length:312 start_codon:yes stop_codon:yes gene_type:complete
MFGSTIQSSVLTDSVGDPLKAVSITIPLDTTNRHLMLSTPIPIYLAFTETDTTLPYRRYYFDATDMTVGGFVSFPCPTATNGQLWIITTATGTPDAFVSVMVI